jgi:hypothetical protein
MISQPRARSISGGRIRRLVRSSERNTGYD